ncbi:MAG: M20/M25/M40 family metallo-hydrolase, partial [Planctomycetota bacterium]
GIRQAALSKNHMLDHVRVLAADSMRGRKTASRACAVAGEYIALQLETSGLKPAGTSAAGGAGYFQPFSVRLGFRPVRSPVLRVGQRALEPGRDFALLAHSGSGKVGAPLVFCGYGVSLPAGGHGGVDWDDYAGKEVKGKIAVVLDGNPELGGVVLRGGVQRKVYTAKLEGAAGLILLSRAEPGKLPHFEPARDATTIPAMLASLPVLAKLVKGLEAAVEGLESGDASEETLDATVQMSVELERWEGVARNVLGLVPGSAPRLADEYVVIGAHYDHLGLGGAGSLEPGSGIGQIHNGADDNASGVAVMLEVARVLKLRKRLGRSVLVVGFSGEEMGLLGSQHFVESPTVPADKIVAMVNLDMVGRSKEGYVAAIGAGTSPAFSEILGRMQSGASVRLSDSSFGGSDHQSFIRKGIPAVHFFSGTHSDYHRPSDDIEKLDLDGMQRIGAIVLELVEQLSLLPERPSFVKPKSRPVVARTSPGARPYLGTIPDYAEGEGGVKITGVSPGSPVAKAGLRGEDVIVQVAGTEIDNLYDFSFALQELRPGQRIEVTVLRGGKRKTFEVIVGGR